MTTRQEHHAHSSYYQLALSGYEGVLQPKNTDSESDKSEQGGTEKAYDWTKKEHIIFVPFVTFPAGVSSGELHYTIQVDSNIDLLISPRPKKGKSVLESLTCLPWPKTKRPLSLPMVLRISEDRQGTLSFADGYPLYEGIARIFGHALDRINYAIQCRLLNIGWYLQNPVHGGVSAESSPAPKSSRSDKARRRREEIRAQILPETQAEDSTKMADLDRSVLGNGSGNSEDLGF